MMKTTFFALALIFLAKRCDMIVQAHSGEDHSDIFCVKECQSANVTDPCGDGYAMQNSCISSDIISAPSGLGYDLTMDMPSGFVGCSLSICETACMDANMTKSMDIVMDEATGVKTFCFPKKETGDGMFMMEDIAEISALSRGCSGSHKMGEMFMYGSMDHTCMDSYDEYGIKFGPESSSSRLMASILVVAPLALFVTSVLIL